MYLPSWTHAKPTVLDVSVISPMQWLTLIGVFKSQRSAITAEEDRKQKAHGQVCHDAGISFVHRLVETLGGWITIATKTISSTGRQLGL